MKVILLTDVKKLGKRGQIVNASDGYAQNYLFPKKLAIPADKQNVTELTAKQAAEAHRREIEKQEAIKVKERLEKEIIVIKVKTGENGKIFGSITSKEISDALAKEQSVNIDKKKIIIKEPIKSVGIYVVELRLFEGVVAKLKVNAKSEV